MTKYSLSGSDLCSAPKSKMQRFSKPTMWVVLISCVVGSLMLYLTQVNAIASKGFALRDLQNQIQTLQTENEKLAVNVVELKSMNELNARVAELKMVPITQVAYYKNTEQVVVRR
ncbi:MAG: hypothetical protein UT32_C0014G0013 [Parcubacteria group bacterium GW2011_GWC2_39_14]|nr:MAG: hypothetical protein UT32_C0014G0013 [Parcubacteria group bacterium GW2011_GWC2_39_14]KKR54461.1 MAG: hypothetical protein UT91_C0015G0013 [Parcubacteria group bacterium GW2011_GWA2_40_23]